MLPGSEIGAALPVVALPLQEPQAADQKVISALKGKFRAVAEARGRPVELAEAMVDPNLRVPGLSAKGEPLTLSADKAVELKVADLKAASLYEALQAAGFSPEVERLAPGPRVQVARFLTSSTVAGLLLALGLLLLLVELFTPGFGVAGALGLAFLALYFAGGGLRGFPGPLSSSSSSSGSPSSSRRPSSSRASASPGSWGWGASWPPSTSPSGRTPSSSSPWP